MEYQTFNFCGIEPTRYGLSLATAPASEPITLTEAKTHCRVDHTADDTYISSLITAARQHIENKLGRRLMTQTWDLFLDRFPIGMRDMRLPWGPWQSITWIKYIDLAGTLQTWVSTDYNLDSASFENRLYLSWTKIYPVPRVIQNAVTIRHVSGVATLNENLKQAVRILVEHWYNTARGIETGYKTEKHQQVVDALISSERQSWI